MNTDLLALPLKVILDSELQRGNSIQEISDWPPKCQLLVVLKRPFHRSYEVESCVQYREIKDPHSWKSEYSYLEGVQVLACN